MKLTNSPIFKIINLGLIVFCCYFLKSNKKQPLAQSAITNKPPHLNKVVILISQQDYSILSNELAQFVNDVQNIFSLELEIKTIEDAANKQPEEIRQILINECNPTSTGCERLEGAIMVGNIPYSLFDSQYDNSPAAPFMFFYQDLDSDFEKDQEGIYYRYSSHGDHKGPEIYTAWIKHTPALTDVSYITQLKNYFDKHHRFLTNQYSPSGNILYANSNPSEIEHTFAYVFFETYGQENITYISPETTSVNGTCLLKPQMLEALTQSPEIAFLHSHSTYAVIFCLINNDFLSLDHLPLILYSWGCSNGNFHLNDDSSTALAFINGSDLGLTYIAKLHERDINTKSGVSVNLPMTEFFRYWNAGYHTGKAFLKMEQNLAQYDNPFDNLEEDINLYQASGPLQRIILGSPFTYSLVTNKNPLPGHPDEKCSDDSNCECTRFGNFPENKKCSFANNCDIHWESCHCPNELCTTTPTIFPPEDINHDGITNHLDLHLSLLNWFKTPPWENLWPDVNQDEISNGIDFALITEKLNLRLNL